MKPGATEGALQTFPFLVSAEPTSKIADLLQGQISS